MLKKNDFKIPAIYSKYAYVSDHSYVDEGTIVMHHGLVNAGSKIGKNCIINNKALIEHDVIIEDNCHISTGAILNGGVEIGSGSFIGSGSIIRESVRIGENCIIGAGNYINNDLTKNSFIKEMKNKVKIIAEAGVNHNGSLEIAKNLIDVAANAGADFVKFQTFRAEKFSHQKSKKSRISI